MTNQKFVVISYFENYDPYCHRCRTKCNCWPSKDGNCLIANYEDTNNLSKYLVARMKEYENNSQEHIIFLDWESLSEFSKDFSCSGYNINNFDALSDSVTVAYDQNKYYEDEEYKQMIENLEKEIRNKVKELLCMKK